MNETNKYLQDTSSFLMGLTREYEDRRLNLNLWYSRQVAEVQYQYTCKADDLHIWYNSQLRKAHDWNEWLECLDLLESEL